jgi:hypothetical protein
MTTTLRIVNLFIQFMHNTLYECHMSVSCRDYKYQKFIEMVREGRENDERFNAGNRLNAHLIYSNLAVMT